MAIKTTILKAYNNRFQSLFKVKDYLQRAQRDSDQQLLRILRSSKDLQSKRKVSKQLIRSTKLTYKTLICLNKRATVVVSSMRLQPTDLIILF